MVDLALETGVTEEELLELDAHDAWVEVIDGEIVPMPPVHLDHHVTGGNLYRPLDRYLEQHPIGYLFMDGLICVLERNENGKIRRSCVPDTAFIRTERLPEDLARPFEGAPDLAVEVISPGNDAAEMLAKVRDYLEHGSEEVWLLYPKLKELHRYRRDEIGRVQVYVGADVLDAAPLFPGLQLTIADLFTLRK
jgi:Uma2 family endonuclease